MCNTDDGTADICQSFLSRNCGSLYAYKNESETTIISFQKLFLSKCLFTRSTLFSHAECEHSLLGQVHCARPLKTCVTPAFSIQISQTKLFVSTVDIKKILACQEKHHWRDIWPIIRISYPCKKCYAQGILRAMLHSPRISTVWQPRFSREYSQKLAYPNAIKTLETYSGRLFTFGMWRCVRLLFLWRYFVGLGAMLSANYGACLPFSQMRLYVQMGRDNPFQSRS